MANLPRLSTRRILAIANLSFKEAIRKRVLYAFTGLLLIVLFGSWFIPSKPTDELRTYVAVVFYAMTVVLMLVGVSSWIAIDPLSRYRGDQRQQGMQALGGLAAALVGAVAGYSARGHH